MKILKYILLLSVMLSAMACESVDSQRIPALNVNIDLSNAGLWNTYGVSGYGMCRIFDREQRIPDNFAYTERTLHRIRRRDARLRHQRPCGIRQGMPCGGEQKSGALLRLIDTRGILQAMRFAVQRLRGRRSARKRAGAREPLRAATAFGCACRRRISDYPLIENFLSFYNYCLRQSCF